MRVREVGIPLQATVVTLKHRILLARYDFNQQPGKIRDLQKNRLIVPRRRSSGKF